LAAGSASLAGLVLALSGGSVAHAGGKGPGERVQSREWLVSIGHRVTKVPANWTVAYCSRDVVESLTPRVVLSAPGAGIHFYGYHLLDPGGQRSTNLFASFRGSKTVVETPFQPLNWAKGEQRETNPRFRPGTYTLQVALNAQIIGGLPKGGKMKDFETLRLKPEKRC
jgi:hypothetical protein